AEGELDRARRRHRREPRGLEERTGERRRARESVRSAAQQGGTAAGHDRAHQRDAEGQSGRSRPHRVRTEPMRPMYRQACVALAVLAWMAAPAAAQEPTRAARASADISREIEAQIEQ